MTELVNGFKVGSHEENCSGFDKSSELTDLGRKLTKTINQIDLIN